MYSLPQLPFQLNTERRAEYDLERHSKLYREIHTGKCIVFILADTLRLSIHRNTSRTKMKLTGVEREYCRAEIQRTS